MKLWTYRVRKHRRYRTDGRVERVKRYRRRPRRLRWRVITDDLFAGLAALVETSGSTVMRVLTISFAVLAVLGFVIVAPFAYLLGHRFGPRRKRFGFKKELRRRTRKYKRAKVRVVRERLGTQTMGWTPEQRKAQRARAARSRSAGRR